MLTHFLLIEEASSLLPCFSSFSPYLSRFFASFEPLIQAAKISFSCCFWPALQRLSYQDYCRRHQAIDSSLNPFFEVKLRNQSYHDARQYASSFTLPSFAFQCLTGIVLWCDSSSFGQFTFIKEVLQEVTKLFLSLLLVLGSDLKDRFSVVFVLLIDEFHCKIIVIVAPHFIGGQDSCELCVILWTFRIRSEDIAFGGGYEIEVIIVL